MNFDQMTATWAAYDRKLDASIRLNRELLRAGKLDRARSALQRLTIGLVLEVILNSAAIAALGMFIADHLTLRFVIPAIALDALAVVNNIVLARQIVAATRIDYGQPITAIQRQLEELRVLRIRYLQWVFLIAVLLWTPLLIVGFEWLFGIDAYQAFGGVYIGANLLLGIALIPLGIWLAKSFGPRLRGTAIGRHTMALIAGASLKDAREYLATLSAFESDEPGEPVLP